MTTRTMTVLTLLAAAIAAHPAAAQDLADGYFTCTIGNFVLGDIVIDNGRYSGPDLNRHYEDFYPLTVDGPTIVWNGPVGGISESGPIVSTVLKDAGGGKAGFDITIQNKDSGNFQTISCSPSD